MIDITGVDLAKFVQKVYELSAPQGLGFLHFKAEPLSEEDTKSIAEQPLRGSVRLNMDYVYGRACKMVVWEKDGKLQIRDSWYDHTDDQFRELLEEFGITLKTTGEHGCACNCKDCRNKPKRAVISSQNVV